MTADALSRIDLLDHRARMHAAQSALAREICRQLDSYFLDPHHRFVLPLSVHGTLFQNRVWRTLRQIPPGRVLRYGDLARQLGTSARAIGGACRQNPIPIVVPCHRVIASSGVGGYMGELSGVALRMKRWLLFHERCE